MSRYVSVDCTIGRNGRVWVKRIKIDDTWQHVEQGRQWADENGRHVLIMLPGSSVEEIILSAESLRWELKPRRPGPQIA